MLERTCGLARCIFPTLYRKIFIMKYVDGFVLAVPKDKIEAYRKLAEDASQIWMDHGALEYKECVLEDISDIGYFQTFPQGFKAKEDETIVFAYITFKSRAHRDEVNKKIHEDPRMKDMPQDMPFDMKRMCYGGFQTIVSQG
jgi:uncharacterized protein YbaA (DUF1428 family)